MEYANKVKKHTHIVLLYNKSSIDITYINIKTTLTILLHIYIQPRSLFLLCLSFGMTKSNYVYMYVPYTLL